MKALKIFGREQEWEKIILEENSFYDKKHAKAKDQNEKKNKKYKKKTKTTLYKIYKDYGFGENRPFITMEFKFK